MHSRPGDLIETEGYSGPERRREIHLTSDQIDRIADRAAEKAAAKAAERAAEIAAQKVIENGYKAVGKNVVEKGLWIVGALALGFGAARGWIKLG